MGDRNPLTNWRWWVSLPLTLIVAVLAAICIMVKALGDIAEQCGDIIQFNTLRPLIRWTWGDSHDQ